MLKPLKNHKGTTMIETVVAMVIFSIIAISVTTILVPTLSAYAMASDLAETNTLLDNVSNEILSDLSNATAVDVSGTTLTITTNVDTVAYTVGASDGFLYKNGSSVLDERYYKGKTVSIEYLGEDGSPLSGTAPGRFYVKVTLMLNSGGASSTIADRLYAVNLLGVT